jgi:hypothetical protein
VIEYGFEMNLEAFNGVLSYNRHPKNACIPSEGCKIQLAGVFFFTCIHGVWRRWSLEKSYNDTSARTLCACTTINI